MMRLEGKTAAGRTVVIEDILNARAKIQIDGEDATIEDYRHYRDGGTRVWITDQGRVTLSRKLGKPPQDYLDGEVLVPLTR